MKKERFIIILFILTITSCRSHEKKIMNSDNSKILKDTLIINVGDLFDKRDERLSIHPHDIHGEVIQFIPYDTSIIFIPKINYNLKYKLVSLTDNVVISKQASDTFLVKNSIQRSDINSKTPTVDFAFIVDDSLQDFFYRYRKYSIDSSIIEWTKEIDTCYIITYQIK